MEKVVSMPASQPGNSILQNFSGKKSSTSQQKLVLAIIGIVVVLSGIGTGYLLSGANKNRPNSSNAIAGAHTDEDESGLADESTFNTTAEGLLVEGGLDGEGAYHLERPGGKSQNVYLTSTVVGLGGYVGKKVQVWGQTVKGRKTGWLMDVGRVKIIE